MDQFDLGKVIDAFRQHMIENNLTIPQGHPIGDGKIHRVPTAREGRNGTAGSYQLHLDGVPNGWIINWQEGAETKKWCATRNFVSVRDPQNELKIKKMMEEMEMKRARKEQERLERQALTAERLKRKYGFKHTLKEIKSPYHPDVPYLRQKGIENLFLKGIYCDNFGNLYVPIYNKNGELQTEQSIDANGNKLYATGGKKENGFHIINLGVNYKLDRERLTEIPYMLEMCETIAIAEGYATTASVFDSVRDKKTLFIAAMDASNMIDVAKELAQQFPDKKYVIIADNDISNTGQNAAKKAAKITGGTIMFPPNNPQDFNDLYQNKDNRLAIKEHFNWCLEKRYGDRHDLKNPFEKTKKKKHGQLFKKISEKIQKTLKKSKSRHR